MAIGDGIDMVVRCYRLKGARLAENESEGGGVGHFHAKVGAV